eukprot:8874954-Pyramimonas_sp.AAC.1
MKFKSTREGRPQHNPSSQGTSHRVDVAERGAIWWEGSGSLVEPSFAPFVVEPLGYSEVLLEGGGVAQRDQRAAAVLDDQVRGGQLGGGNEALRQMQVVAPDRPRDGAEDEQLGVVLVGLRGKEAISNPPSGFLHWALVLLTLLERLGRIPVDELRQQSELNGMLG